MPTDSSAPLGAAPIIFARICRDLSGFAGDYVYSKKRLRWYQISCNAVRKDFDRSERFFHARRKIVPASVSFGKILGTSRKDFVFDSSGPASVSFGKISTPSRQDFIFGPASVSFGKILTTSRQDFFTSAGHRALGSL